MIGVPKGINQRWREIPLSFYDVKTLFSQYRRVIITAQVDQSDALIYLDVDQFKVIYNDFSGFIPELFADLGNKSVTALANKPIISPKRVLWNDVFRAGYQVDTWNRLSGKNAHPDEQFDALLTRASPVTSYTDFAKTCLVSVNGFFHLSDTDGKTGVIVYEAGRSLKKSKSNQMGLLSFSKLCNIKQIPITESMLRSRQTQDQLDAGEDVQPFKTAGYIHVDGNLTNKTVLLVLGGYLITPDTSYFKRVGDNDFVIDFSEYPLADRYYESLKYLDLSTLSLSGSYRNPTQIAISELYSDEVLKQYLKLMQSFIVILDTPEIYTERSKLHCVNISGVYTTTVDTTMPLALSTGRMPEYWLTNYDGLNTLTVNDAIAMRRTYNKAIPGELPTMTRSPLPSESKKPADAYLVEIGIDIAYKSI
jgi:hypothetical protein